MDFESIINSLIGGELTLEEASRLMALEARRDGQRTRFWPQRIESELSRGRITATAARALLDALEDFQPERTVWLDANQIVTRPDAVKSVQANSPPGEAICDLEQLRAMLFEPNATGEKPPVAPSHQNETPPAPPAVPPAQMDIGLAERRVGAEIGGRYRLDAYMGLAGVGQVFAATDVKEGRAVTLKLIALDLKAQPGAFAAIAAAARRSQALLHPNIAQLYDVDRDGDEVFVTFEPLKGRWLSQLIREVRSRGLVYDRAWPIISGVGLGLAHAHSHGVLHESLSPHSIFLCEDGVPKIVGFGLLRAAPVSNESLDVLDTQTLRAYSEAYTADPWSQSGASHASDDLYPLGVMAYELLTGQHPFQRCSLVQARQKNLTYQPIPGLRRRARTLIDRCLSFERATRPGDARVFVRRMNGGMLKRIFAGTG